MLASGCVWDGSLSALILFIRAGEPCVWCQSPVELFGCKISALYSLFMIPSLKSASILSLHLCVCNSVTLLRHTERLFIKPASVLGAHILACVLMKRDIMNMKKVRGLFGDLIYRRLGVCVDTLFVRKCVRSCFSTGELLSFMFGEVFL